MKLIPVAIVIPYIVTDGALEVWVQTRKSSDELNGLMEFPGGKIEADEVPAQSARREALEETGADIPVEQLKLLNIYAHNYPAKTVSIYAFLYECAERDHLDGDWVTVGSDWEDRLSGRIPEANLKIFKDLQRQFLL